MRAFGNDNIALVLLLDALLDLRQELVLVERLFRHDQQVDMTAQAGGSRQPAGISAHGLENEDFLTRIDVDIQPGLQSGRGDELRRAGKARAVIGFHQVIVDGLRAAYETVVLDAHLLRIFAQRSDGVHGIVAAGVEHGFNVVFVEDLDQLLKIRNIVSLQLVAAGSQRGRRCLPQDLVLFFRHVREIHKALVQNALDAVESSVNMIVNRIHLIGFDDAGHGRIDDGCRSAGLPY